MLKRNVMTARAASIGTPRLKSKERKPMFRYAMMSVVLAATVLAGCAVGPDEEAVGSSESALTKKRTPSVNLTTREGRRVTLENPTADELATIVDAGSSTRCCRTGDVCGGREIIACILDLVVTCPYNPTCDDQGCHCW
jgi:hypothetical protein